MNQLKEEITRISKMVRNPELFRNDQPTDNLTTEPPKETGTGFPNFEHTPPPPLNTTIELQGFYASHDKAMKPMPKEPVINWLQNKGMFISKDELIGLGFEYDSHWKEYNLVLKDDKDLYLCLTVDVGFLVELKIRRELTICPVEIKIPHTFKAISKRIKHIKKAFGL